MSVKTMSCPTWCYMFTFMPLTKTTMLASFRQRNATDRVKGMPIIIFHGRCQIYQKRGRGSSKFGAIGRKAHEFPKTGRRGGIPCRYTGEGYSAIFSGSHAAKMYHFHIFYKFSTNTMQTWRIYEAGSVTHASRDCFEDSEPATIRSRKK